MKKFLPFLSLFFAHALNAQQPTFQWGRAFGGLYTDNVSAQAVDNAGNIFTTGNFSNTVDFDPGSGIFELTSNTGYTYISKLDASGNFLWAKSMLTGYSGASGMEVDNAGNVYLTGYFGDTCDFDPGPGVFNLFCPGNLDAFVCKLNSAGELVWAKSIGGFYSSDLASSITVDASQNVYLLGSFDGTADFDPGAGIYELDPTVINQADSDLFIEKLDASGNFIWARTIGGPGSDAGWAIKVDESGSVYTTGYFSGTGDYDPGAQTYNLTPVGQNDIFISKLDATGNFVWAKKFGGASFEFVYSLVLDDDGNIFTTGIFGETVDFDPGNQTFNLTSTGFNSVFISKLNSSGEFVWARKVGGGGSNNSNSIAVDAAGNSYTVGIFTGLVNFDPGSGVNIINSADGYIFLLKLNASGDFVSVTNFASLPADDYDWSFSHINLDAAGNIYIGGTFLGTDDLNPGSESSNFTSSGDKDVFIIKLNQGTITASNDVLSHSFTAYPNPSNGIINLKYVQLRKALFEIYTASGTLVSRREITDESTLLDVSELVDGMYILKVINEDGRIWTERISKID